MLISRTIVAALLIHGLTSMSTTALKWPSALTQAQQPTDPSSTLERWQPFTSEAGNFSILMPQVAPDALEAREADEFGQVMARTQEETIAYGVFYANLPMPAESLAEEEVDQVLNAAVEGFIEDWETKNLISERKVMLDNSQGEKFPGKEVEIEGSEGLFKLRLYWVNPRLYLLLVGSQSPEQFPADSDQFLDSFQLLSLPAEDSPPE
ncbi:MAG: hypothetical protein ACFBSC_03250 [Microcoleaceae cyanobacterium]